ncbi:S-layer homology domain-containing protein [Anaerobacillus sp. MEB173]|uniref:S-layer homology domain-containing protein n=1 Tax=Anaerobacillus sp. MEB173 TaxID=3383345 RepID=UPI003F8FF96B
MSYQPKSYRKFLATTVATAMVATGAAAVAPTSADAAAVSFNDVVAGSYYAEAVNKMAEAGFIQGVGNGNFGTNQELLRRDAAVLFSRALLWDVENVSATNFTDVEAGKYYHNAVAKAVELGVIAGKSSTKFAPADKLTRGEMAVLLTRALNLTVDPSVNVPLKDIAGHPYENAIKAVYQAGLTTGFEDGTYRAGDTVTRAQFATFLYRDAQIQENVASQLKFEVKSVKGLTSVVDSESEGQYLQFGINGENKAANLEDLKEAGYEVEFQVTNEAVLVDAATGELDADALTDGQKFDYKVVITKDDVVVESDVVTVSVEEFAATITSINDYSLFFNNNVESNSGVITLADTNVSLGNIVVEYKDGKEAPLNGSNANLEFSSSNTDVALIDNNGVITPVAAGNVTFTIKAGDVTKNVTVTVSADSRTATNATVSKNAIGLVVGVEDNFELAVTDQFGDAVKNFGVQIAAVENNDKKAILTIENEPATDAKGKALVAVKAHATNEGTGTLEVKNNNGDVLGTIAVTVDADTTVATRKIELVSASDDLNLDLNPLNDDAAVQLVLNEYNAQGLKIGAHSFPSNKYTVTSTNTNVFTVAAADNKVAVTAKGEGKATLQIKEGSIVRYSAEINVVDTTPFIVSASFKSGIELTSTGTLNLEKDLIDSIVLSGEGTVAYEVKDGDVEVYLNVENGNNIFLGTIDVLSNHFANAHFAEVEGKIVLVKDVDAETDEVTGFTAGDQGSVTLRLIADGETNAKAVRTVKVDVK